MKKKGVLCTVVLNDVMSISCTNGGSRDAQLSCLSELCVASIVCMVACTCSDTEFPCGRYGVLQIFSNSSLYIYIYIYIYCN